MWPIYDQSWPIYDQAKESAKVPSEERAWTLEDEEAVKRAKQQLADLEARRNRSYSEVGEKLVTFFNKECNAHSYDYRAIAHLVNTKRWQLLEILSEGRYSAMMAALEVAAAERE